MTFRGFISRADAGLRAPRSRSTAITPQHGGVARHHAGPAQNVSTALGGHPRCVSLWRGYQNYHMNTHGWVDIAYTGGVCQHGYAFAGRGAGVRTAANGTNFGNQNYYAICWIGGGSERPTKDAIYAFWWFYNELRKNGNAGSSVKDHFDFKATTCSGNFAFNKTPTDPTEPTWPTNPEDDEMLERGDEGDAVKAYQRRLLQWIDQSGRTGAPYEAFEGYGDDGDFGGTTEATVKEFQKAYDIPATGKIGAVTAGLLAMYATGSATGGLSKAEADTLYAPKSHGSHTSGLSVAQVKAIIEGSKINPQ